MMKNSKITSKKHELCFIFIKFATIRPYHYATEIIGDKISSLDHNQKNPDG
jgi:hypothetical protein